METFMDIQIFSAQALGIVAMILTILSMQFRSNVKLFICQEISGALFALSFLMMGAWGGMIMNIYSLIRPELLRHEHIAKSKWTLFGLQTLLVICAVLLLFVFKEAWYLVLIITTAQMSGTYFMWTQNGKIIRIGQASVVSPLWMTYNLIIPVPSIGGVLTESINIASVIISLYRYRKTGFTQR
ncbi:MAG: YgjV family protein [Lentisphaerae bacterium]|nr:YgjV family protein [Lentisphaerota bacterium]